MARQARRGLARHGADWRGLYRQVKARQARRGKAWRGKDWHGRQGKSKGGLTWI